MSRGATDQPRAVWCCSTCGAIYHKDFPRCPADGAEVVRAERDPLLGVVIGHYTIARLVGEGGMARVYLAHHANLPNKRYAFKVLLGDHAASIAMRARFTREAERASQLDHPNVVKVIDFGQTRHGLLYIAMDYVEGPSLVSLIGETPMPPARVIALTRAICKGLVYAHGTGIVHRDLKPENILVTAGPDGDIPRIVDFGLAMSIDQSDARLTESGMTMGTPAFASPEQISGKPIDHRADLYALGLTMFEMLTGGVAPFEGHVMETVSARTARDAPRISARAPELAVPPDLDDIVARLTRRKPGERFQSAREVIDALDGVRLGPQAQVATEPMDVRRPRRWGWIAAGLAASAVAAGGWYFGILGHHPGRWAAASRVDSARAGVETVSAAPGPSAAAPSPAATPAAATPAAATPAAAIPAAAAPAAEPVATVRDVRRDDRPRGHTSGPTPSKHRRPRERAARPVVSVAAAPEPPPAAPPASIAPAGPPVALVAAPPPASPPAPAAPPAELQARIDSVDVAGSLPVREVQRAVERRRAALERCMPAAPETVVARFSIGETRRARDVRTAGPTAATNSCVAAAFTDVRTEAAPDVGDVEVTVRVAFVVKT